MSEERALVPVEERTVVFYDDEIKSAVVTMAGTQPQIFVPVRPLCDFLGVDWSGQLRRINNDPVLSHVIRQVEVNTPGGKQSMQCVPLDYLNGWLFGINANRVKEDIRERLIRYQRECYLVLRDAFQEPVPAAHPLAQVEQMGLAIARMAREQMQFDSRLTSTQDQVSDLSQRVVVLEERIAPGASITEEQASQLSQAVKAVAMELSKQSGRNEYGGVYGELYRKFSITSYKLLPAAKFQESMSWLTDWYGSITDKDVPF